MKALELEIRSEQGLHARPAADLVRTAAAFRSKIGLENRTVPGPAADARSLTSILAAGVERGHRVRIWADGEDEEEALAAVRALLDGVAPPAASVGRAGAVAAAGSDSAAGSGSGGRGATGQRLSGVPAAPGIAVGPVWLPETRPAIADSTAGRAPGDRLRGAAVEAAAQLNALAAQLGAMERTGEGEILEAQALIAADPVLLDAAERLTTQGRSPVGAIVEAAEIAARTLEELGDELLAARAADVRDVAARIARNAAGVGVAPPVEPSVAVAVDLAPSVLVEAPRGAITGVVLAAGSATAHVAILARGLGIPAVVAADGLAGLLDDRAGAHFASRRVAVDGDTGEVVLDPGEADVARFEDLRAARAARRRRAESLRRRPATTRDGRRIRLLANIRNADDAPRALAAGAEGVGLFRTEFLFLHRTSAPTEVEQVAAYRRAMEVFGPDRPVVVRLADIGGDKLAPYLGLAEEPNPFLGVRAIRLAHGSRDLLVTQLRAIWRAGGLAGVTPHVMAPMVATVADVRLLLDMRDEARAGVVASGQPCPERMVTGVMIEVPSAAVLASDLAGLVDFFSIGTNDLTQYVLAADRGNPALARMQDALHPAVLRMIAAVVSGAATAGIPVAACGELAGDPAGALVLAGLGVDELSADPGSLDEVRLALSGVDDAEMRALAEAGLAATDAETVRELAGRLRGRAWT